MLQEIYIKTPLKNTIFEGKITYEIFGKALGTAPIVLVNHALTGNSTVAGDNGWWKKLIGENEVIDTHIFTVLAFNIPGNGYGGNFLKEDEMLTIEEVALLFLEAIRQIGISKIEIGIGGSIGGALLWQMAYLSPDLFSVIIPIATDYKASDWLIAQTYLQKLILKNSKNPLTNARIHAMLLYRTPHSINQRFRNTYNEQKDKHEVQDWLDYHGRELQRRFDLQSYILMNHLLSTIRVASSPEDLTRIKADIHIITVDTDLFFTPDNSWQTYETLTRYKTNVSCQEIKSPHGHDAFLIEYEQLRKILMPIFEPYHTSIPQQQYYEAL